MEIIALLPENCSKPISPWKWERNHKPSYNLLSYALLMLLVKEMRLQIVTPRWRMIFSSLISVTVVLLILMLYMM